MAKKDYKTLTFERIIDGKIETVTLKEYKTITVCLNPKTHILNAILEKHNDYGKDKIKYLNVISFKINSRTY